MEIVFRNDWIDDNICFKQFGLLEVTYEATELDDIQHCFTFVLLGLGFHIFITQEYDIRL